MSVREKILSRIRSAQGRGASRPSRAELEAVETYLRAHPRGPLPTLAGERIARFLAKAQENHATTAEIASWNDAPAAVAGYLKSQGLPLAGCVWPALAALDWKGAGLALEPRAAEDRDAVGVTGAFAAIAETGTLMLVGGPDTPATASLLPETHIALVSAARIVFLMEEAWDWVRAELRELPRTVNFVSGPSRTGDIEQRLVLGAHGPRRVHVVIVAESVR